MLIVFPCLVRDGDNAITSSGDQQVGRRMSSHARREGIDRAATHGLAFRSKAICIGEKVG